ncbi:MAG TPA: lysophospholipid acyltransferase family protein [Rhodopila sp.]|nr:lysophospholipid acyltransferase family protein [Rhodopila sp.]
MGRRPAMLPDPNHNPGFLLQLPQGRDGWLVARRIRVARRGLAILAWTVVAVVIQALCLLLPGQAKVTFARFYWAVFARLIGVEVRVIGQPAATAEGRPILYVSNHSSWVDIPVIGGVLDGCFVSKGEVATWPVISAIARLGRTVFVSRSRTATGRERDEMRRRLEAGDKLILFPEGTSSDGSRVLPFRTSFFAVAERRGDTEMSKLPIIQPVSVVYDRLGGLPAGRASRPIFAWYGDMDIASHFWRLTQHIGLRATVLLHAPVDPARFADRKALSQAVWKIVADGASTLRQNRPARPLDAAAEPGADLPEGSAIFA